MKAIKLAVIMAALIIFSAVATLAMVNHGAEQLTINGGSKGEVSFPHKEHQDIIGDCTACHDVFPMELGVIKTMKANKELKRKQVMNKTCIKCHRARKSKGESYGPISCNDCHTKK
jgi:uncharacterized membrane protein